MEFNSAPSSVMLMDVNSCFATIEQQANPLLRGRPVVVAAFTTPNGCILASSIDAKKLGIKTGMRVKEGKDICPGLVVLPPDPWKYRNIHLKLKKLLENYAPEVTPKSIDEFILKPVRRDMWAVARDIKQRIKEEIGDYITVSIGIAPNRYLAKVAAGLIKPDGLVEINKDNFLEVYKKLKLTDLTGIKVGNATRLNSMGIYTVLDFYDAPIWKLKAALHSITGLYWYTRLHGYEVDEVDFGRKSYGNSVALGKDLSTISDLSPILARLTEKMSARVRTAGYKASGIHLALFGKDGNFWHKGKLTQRELFSSRDFFREAHRLLVEAHPASPIGNIAVSCFGLTKNQSSQLEIFADILKDKELTESIDKVNRRWGDFVVGSARGFESKGVVKDRIAFHHPL